MYVHAWYTCTYNVCTSRAYEICFWRGSQTAVYMYMHVATIYVCIVDFLDFDSPALASLHALML